MADTVSTNVQSIRAEHAQAGQWIVYNNERMNQRIVDVEFARDGDVKVSADYGNGGEPASMFFEKDDIIQVRESEVAH